MIHAFRSVVMMALITALMFLSAAGASADDLWVTYEPAEGAGEDRHIVLVAGEWEYRSEEGLPMLAKILSQRHGFKCTVLFPINAKTGEIDPNVIDNIPGLELLKSADMMIILAMDLELPDQQMKHFVEFVESGRPILGIRCSLLTFKYKKNPNSPYARYSLGSKEGGFGRIVLGGAFGGHHGHHAVESTRGMVNGPQRGHPILRGVGGDIWGPTDVYRINRLPEDATVLIHGQVLKGMNPDDAPNYEKPIMPMVWTHTFESPSGKSGRVVTSTIGASQDLESEDLRRVVVNGVYWALGLEDKIPEKSNVDYVGDFKAIPFGRNKFTKGVRPQDLALPGG